MPEWSRSSLAALFGTAALLSCRALTASASAKALPCRANLRDADSAAPTLFQHFGLLESDYDEKPAFAAYRALVRELGGKARVRP